MSRIPIHSHISNSLGDSSQKTRTGSEDFVIPLILILPPLALLLAAGAIIINFSTPASEGPQKNPESLGNRQIILNVPETSRVDAIITSESDIVNIQNL